MRTSNTQKNIATALRASTAVSFLVSGLNATKSQSSAWKNKVDGGTSSTGANRLVQGQGGGGRGHLPLVCSQSSPLSESRVDQSAGMHISETLLL